MSLLRGALAFGQPRLLAPDGARFASLKSLKSRLTSVKSIQKITKAMKMVAASKLRGAQTRMEASRPFVGSSPAALKEALDTSEAKSEKHFFLPISSDKGLCGGVNSSVVKATKAMVSRAKEAGESTQLFIVGSKARDALVRDFSPLLVANVDEIYQKPFSWAQAAVLADQVLKSDFDKLSIIYNKFYSVVRFEVTPLHLGTPALLAETDKLDAYEVDEEEDAEMMADLFQFELASRLFNCVLENSTSENASRMTAMDNASKNAKDMITKLQVVYNRQRQAVITTELNEIISGAESL
ncbi:hypothetical protein KFE25_004195 [Diacronema lutheri]|uniref:ATP synthase subunit gamma, mitochondrial n=2 Tax=Diacronema lutheri TaxID=2081491 RepID=A0A8J5X256_DIALT|nr:hypothetical protein KFE25_004195 [Diacronema lutheri]